MNQDSLGGTTGPNKLLRMDVSIGLVFPHGAVIVKYFLFWKKNTEDGEEQLTCSITKSNMVVKKFLPGIMCINIKNMGIACMIII